MKNSDPLSKKLDVSERRLDLLLNMSSVCWVTAKYLGAWTCSYHHNDLKALWRMGLLIRKKTFTDKWAMRYQYKLSERGEDYLIADER